MCNGVEETKRSGVLISNVAQMWNTVAVVCGRTEVLDVFDRQDWSTIVEEQFSDVCPALQAAFNWTDKVKLSDRQIVRDRKTSLCIRKAWRKQHVVPA